MSGFCISDWFMSACVFCICFYLCVLDELNQTITAHMMHVLILQTTETLHLMCFI